MKKISDSTDIEDEYYLINFKISNNGRIYFKVNNKSNKKMRISYNSIDINIYINGKKEYKKIFECEEVIPLYESSKYIHEMNNINKKQIIEEIKPNKSKTFVCLNSNYYFKNKNINTQDNLNIDNLSEELIDTILYYNSNTIDFNLWQSFRTSKTSLSKYVKKVKPKEFILENIDKNTEEIKKLLTKKKLKKL